MELFPRRSHRLAALAALGLGGAGLLLGILPSRGQQSPATPSLRFSSPGAAAVALMTDVSAEVSLPAGYSLVRLSYVRVLNARNKLTEWLPMLLTQRTPLVLATRGLHTTAYKAGDYQVRGEVEVRTPDGTTTVLESPWVKLTVPKRS